MAGLWASFQPPASAGSFSPDTMLLLTDGSVLIHSAAGGNTNYSGSDEWIRLTPDSSGNYATGAWSALLTMSNTRQFFSSAVLRDGRVYALGGEYSNAGSGSGDTSLGEIFDPQKKISPWSQFVTAFNWIQGDASGAVLADGRVLLGNLQTTSPPFKTALWDPDSDDWDVAGSGFGALTSDTKNSNCNEETWTLLPDGSVLAIDIYDEPNAERYIPSIDEWVSAGTTPSNLVLTTITDPTGATVNVFEIGPAILLPDGRVFAIGGTGQTALYTPPPVGSDPKTNPGTWAAGQAFPNDTSPGAIWPTLTASDAPAVLQTNGRVLCTAGSLYESGQGTSKADYFSQNMTFLEFDPTTNALTPFSPVPFSASSAPNTWVARFLLLPTGQILLTTQGSEIYIYTPDAADNNPQEAWRPTITAAPSTLVTGHTYTITGTQFNGLSQAVSYGDDAQMATNYPIVQLSNAAGDVIYLRSFNFSTMAVATGSQSVSTEIEVPLTVAPGAWQMVVIANGIASQPVDVEVAIWVDNDLTGFAGLKSRAVSGSALDGYSQDDSSQHVNFIDENGHVHELYRSPDPAAQWVDNDLTGFAGLKSFAAFGSALDGYAQDDGSQHVNFIDAIEANGHVHELYRSPDPAAQWVDNDLTSDAGLKSFAGGPGALEGYAQDDGSQHVNFIEFIEANGHVHELYRSPDPAAQWVDNDLTSFSDLKSFAAVGSALDAYAQGDRSQHVNFIDANGHVHELYRSPDPAAQWVDNDLTSFAGLKSFAAVGSALDGYAQDDGSQHVNFIDANGHVHELYWNP